MKLAEALTLLERRRAADLPVFSAQLACGFTPLHLATFLAAHLANRMPDRRVDVSSGLYGDLPGTLERLPHAPEHAAAVALEWQDLDPRLGVRQLGGWSHRSFDDILTNVSTRLEWMHAPLARAARRFPVALSLPTLPLPPIALTGASQASVFELRLREKILTFASRAAEVTGVRVVGPQALEKISPSAGRLDLRSELHAGYPYSNTHADVLAKSMAHLLAQCAPKKGLITDLDDTLWGGLAGEIGPDRISWDLANHTQLHGLYQQLLHALAERGVLLAAASRNDAETVEAAFARPDLLLPRSCCYPVEAHWRPKSESVGRILRAWNVNADSVVFVDDSPMELDEVRSVYPSMECLLFPKQDHGAAWDLFHRLRDLFGKERVSGEDALRLESLRAPDSRQPGGDPERFLEQANAVLTVSPRKSPPDPRCLELVNKTNQFNLNGRRYSEAEWREALEADAAFLLAVSYRDKYGALGKIAVLKGQTAGACVRVDTWVMSCRAFARRIEHRCLELLFRRFDAREAVFAFAPTERNGPLREFFNAISGEAPGTELRVSRERFEARCPRLFHEVELLTE